MEPIQWAITERVMALRKSRDEARVDLAVVLDVDRAFIAEVETYRRAYNILHLNKIAHHYNCMLHDLIPEKSM